ncbi:Ger(x)C family spore germination protein [Anaeromicrobium sediminis]|uniref:Ger(x)C family spore germination protein n=1 Tax=Anaeromicrobium sediminis TaxID=1478221 RepID=UPI0015951709|nr:Ger(x)C family spore germination protein [Anaeromicrobium sediminis]
MKKYIAILFIPIILCGCWNYREINDRRLISGAAVDYNPSTKKYIVTFEAIDPMTEEGEENRGEIFTIEGDSPFDAVRNIVSKSGIKFYWPHAKVIILSEELAKKDILPILDYIYRDGEMRNDIWILISKEKSAADILKVKEKEYMPIPSFRIDRILKMESQNSLIGLRAVPMDEFIQRLYEPNQNPSLPGVKIEKNNGTETIIVTGLAVFKKDRLLGWLSDDESRTLLTIEDNVKRGYEYYDGEIPVGLKILSSKTRTKVKLVDNEINIYMDIDIEANIIELGGNVDYIKEKRRVLMKELEEKKKKDIEDLIKKVQNEFGVDIFDFSRYVKAQQPELWNKVKGDWDKVFDEVKFNINVDVLIKGSEKKDSPIMVNN